MKQTTFTSNTQDEIIQDADKIEKIKEMLGCLLSEKTKACKNCKVVDGCSHLQAAVFCIIKE